MRKLILIIAFVLVLPVLSFAEGSALSLFVKGNDAYKNKDYETAIKHYEAILKEGKASSSVYFNLGNAYFRSGETGRAVLNYKRAQRLDTRNSDLLFNLKYAEGSIRRAPQSKKNILDKLVEGHIQFYTSDEMILVITLDVFMLGLVFLLSRFLKWPKHVRYTTRFICGVLIFMFGFGLILKTQAEKHTGILLKKTPAYFEPLVSSTEHFQLYEGASVKIVHQQEQWVKIKRADGLLGWVPRESIEEI